MVFAGQRRASQILSFGMSKTFRAWKIDEPLFLPPTVGDFVAHDHLARFVLSLVRDEIASLGSPAPTAASVASRRMIPP